MPCVQAKIKNSRALLHVIIASPGSLESSIVNGEISIKVPKKITPTHALVDTGATVSAIQNSVADDLNIRPEHYTESIEGVHGAEASFVYFADLCVPHTGLVVPNVKLIGIKGLQNSVYQAIIGMNVIRRGTLHFTYPLRESPEGSFTFCT